MNPIRVTIITPVYNCVDYIEQCIRSVIYQSYKNIEYIIIDGGSNDGTIEIIERYSHLISYWISESDSGIYNAINKGIKVSTGNLVGILNADDILYINAVTEVVTKINKNHNIKYSIGPVDLIDKYGNIYGTSFPFESKIRYIRRFLEMPFPHQSLFVGSDIYKIIGGYDENFRLSSDYDFALKLMESNFCCVSLSRPIAQFRSGGLSGGTKTWLENHKVRVNHGLNFITSYLIILRSILKVLIFKITPRKILNIIKKFVKSKNKYL